MEINTAVEKTVKNMPTKIQNNPVVESKETIDVSDIEFSNLLDICSDINVPTSLFKWGETVNMVSQNLTASPKSLISKDFEPIADCLYAFLPLYLQYYFSINHNKSAGTQVYRKLKVYTTAVTESLVDYKVKNNVINTLLKELSTVAKQEEHLDNLHDLVTILKRTNFYKKLQDMDKKIFLLFYKIYTAEDFDEKNFERLSKTFNYIPDTLVRKLVRTIENENADVSQKFKLTKTASDKATKKIFGKVDPSSEDIRKLASKSPEKYKEWRKALYEYRKTSKEVLVAAWKDKEFKKTEDVSKVRSLLKELNIQDPVDKNFVGKLALSETPSMFFVFYTSTGLPLVNTPGTNIKMNKLYDTKKDNTYYCSSIPNGSITNHAYRHYTVNYTKKSSGKLFESAKSVADNIDSIRQKIVKDIKTSKGTTYICAVIARLTDLTCARMGNSKSESKSDRFGLHNLQGRHITKNKKDNVVIAYSGKTGKDQKHIVEDKEMKKILLGLKAGIGKNDYIFASPNKPTQPISPNNINKYLKSIGFEGTHHRFRKYHASKMFGEFLASVKIKQGDKKDTLQKYKDAVDNVAKLLGNTAAVAASAYIDPALQVKYFKRANIEPPTALKKALAKSYLADPDSED